MVRTVQTASAFEHPVSQSGTGAFRCRTGFSYPGTGLVPASAFSVPEILDAGLSDIPALIKKYTPHIHTANRVVENYIPCASIDGRCCVIIAV
jgi:hypothetical protein